MNNIIKLYSHWDDRGRVDSAARELSMAENAPFPRNRCRTDFHQCVPESKAKRNNYSHSGATEFIRGTSQRNDLHDCANRGSFSPRASINKKSCAAGQVEGHRSCSRLPKFLLFFGAFPRLSPRRAGELIFVIYSAGRGARIPLHSFSTLHPVSLIFLLTLFLT